jgi:O-antigen chain-terminating methyltransferase
MVNLLAVEGLGPDAQNCRSHRPGVLGKVIYRAKAKIQRWLWSLFRSNVEVERDFRKHVVRFLNEVSFYIDDRDGAQFWELIKKIDVDVGRSLRRIDELVEEQRALIVSAESRTQQLVHSNSESFVAASQAQQAQITTLDTVVRGLEGIINRLPQGKYSGSGESAEDGHSPTGGGVDYSYLLLENRYRGSVAAIAERCRPYVQVFNQSKGPVLDVGAGRGELVHQLSLAGISAYGVDLDQAMVAEARSQGVDVRLENGLRHLGELQDESLGGVVAIQVVEHLTREQLGELFSLCRRKVRAGGLVVFETINPCSLVALSSNYFRDLTHVWPLHPDTLSYQMELCGLRTQEVRYLSPVPESAMLRQIPLDQGVLPSVRSALETVNHNVRQLNSLLYGYQDYCVIAQVGG